MKGRLLSGASFLPCFAPDGAASGGVREIYSVAEAGAKLGLSRNSAYEAVRRGEIPHIRIGRRILVPKPAFDRMLESGKDDARYGAELEDLEDSSDAEHDDADAEPSVGVDAYEFDPCDEGEQKNYLADADYAIIATRAARYTSPPEPEQRGVLTYSAVDPETGRAGMWVLERRKLR